MRLSKIKLAGFKSFVDPTTVYLSSNLSAIVGPNGCGKSNVIDAIRWVMGETSARHLRGDSMEDVIFNGSAARKPIGTASIELFFDNSDGSIGGEYARYAEISIRRLVGRDGQSQYFLNNTRCRRKDITGIFLGTGLGPRSYAIIEQGMVSRLVEAKPEEMRSYIEEAAGISKYKERRRETENRIQHTRENLARLHDLREEVDKQIKHLQRQAQQAERYRALKQDERHLEGELFAIRLIELDRSLDERRIVLAQRQKEQEAVVAEQRRVEASIEQARAEHVEATEAFNQTQARFYGVQSEISRLEQAIAHAREIRDRQGADLEQAEASVREIDAEIEKDEAKLREIAVSLEHLVPGLTEARAAAEASARDLERAKAALDEWQNRWHEFNLDLKEHQQTTEVEQTRISHLEADRARLQRQAELLVHERSRLGIDNQESQVLELARLAELAGQRLSELGRELDGLTERGAATREQEQLKGAEIEKRRGELEASRGRLVTLQSIQEAALGDGEERVAEWFAQEGLSPDQRLVHEIVVTPQWERAVETVLGDFLQAICVPECTTHLGALPNASLVMLEPAAQAVGASVGTLLEKVENASSLADVLGAVYVAGDLAEAIARRRSLLPSESIITPDGIWLGPNWVRVARGQRYEGLIARGQEIRELADSVEMAEQQIRALEHERDGLRARIAELEEQRNAGQREHNEATRAWTEAEARVSAAREELERNRRRDLELGAHADEARRELDGVQRSLAEAEARRAMAGDSVGRLEGSRSGLQVRQDELLADYSRIREQAEADRANVNRIMIEYESRRASQDSASTALERLTVQKRQLVERIDTLRAQIAGAEEPIAGYQGELERQLADELTVEQELGARREQLGQVEQSLRRAEVDRSELEKRAASQRETVDGLRMEVREIEVRREAVAERFGATGLEIEAIAGGLSPEANAEEWEQKLARIRASIERLGPINLAAIDEFSEQAERKTYLDAQYADLSAALDTLEQAIRKIDRETRSRFQETFDRINSGMQRIFPRLFGGGHAYLTLDGDDLLSAGVTVMARPPGKRNSHIHLLSGGEKALTAVALIFSIFELNPAPFCLLDEVDAPLDDANVVRFCEIVKEMSRTVQFLVITHNKTTMEMANQLTGVTMSEPGVSRLVTVDIDEAVALVAS